MMELKIEHLRKQFKDKTAVDDVSLTLTNGVWGLLGANGAGKTTLMRMIADIMTPTSGTMMARIFKKWEKATGICLAFCRRILGIIVILLLRIILNIWLP